MQTLILNHYPPAIKQIKDIQQIAKVEDIEFSKLYASIDKVIRNMFVFTADITGVQRFERLLGIKPEITQSLEDRKMYIIFMLNRQKMSLSELTAMLSDYSEGIKLINDIANMQMVVEMNVSTISIETLNGILEEILPLNIYFHFAMRMKKGKITAFALHEVGARLKVKPMLQNKIRAAGQNDIRAATHIGARLKVKALLNTQIKTGTQKTAAANLRALNRIKIKAYAPDELKAEMAALGSIKAYHKNKLAMTIRKE